MFALAFSFSIVALLYSMVGFGGGTSYIALLAAAGTPYLLVPKLSLICNLLVVSGGMYHYRKNGHFSWKLIFPFVLSSVPMAFMGGVYPVSEKTFYIVLAVSLLLCGLRLLFLPDRKIEQIRAPSFLISSMVGGILGFLSGMVGIGGGIFLSPILINMGWARSKDAAAVASAFIFLNSLAGLMGQFTKHPDVGSLAGYAPLFIAVLLGGQIGSRIGSNQFISYGFIQKSTGLLTLFISSKLLLKVVTGF